MNNVFKFDGDEEKTGEKTDGDEETNGDEPEAAAA